MRDGAQVLADAGLLDGRRATANWAKISRWERRYPDTKWVRGRRFVADVVSLEPDWVICLLGGNDATRVGPEPNKTQIGPEETARNFEVMRRIVREQTEAQWAWIAPPTYDEERAAAFPPFKIGQSVS